MMPTTSANPVDSKPARTKRVSSEWTTISIRKTTKAQLINAAHPDQNDALCGSKGEKFDDIIQKLLESEAMKLERRKLIW